MLGFLVKGSRVTPGSREVAPDDGGAEKNKILRSGINRNRGEALDLQRPG